MKSTIARELVTAYTLNKPMPGCDKASMPAGHVLYITAEDSKDDVWAAFDLMGADTNLISVHEATDKEGNQLNVLEQLAGLEETIKELNVRLVILDGQNSLVGAPNISTDMLARNNVSNPLHQFAQRLDICVLGLRNEDPLGRAYGAASMKDIARCIWRAVKVDPPQSEYFRLEFERISNSAERTHPPIPYSVIDLSGRPGGRDDDRRIDWYKEKPQARQPQPMKKPPFSQEDGFRAAALNIGQRLSAERNGTVPLN